VVPIQYHIGTAHGLGLVEKYPLRQASESAKASGSASDVPNCECYEARQRVCYMSGMT
jgi:hypothetical protein